MSHLELLVFDNNVHVLHCPGLLRGFDVGSDERHIATVDADGVALAAIQGLYEIVQENHQEIQAQSREIAALRQQLAQAGDLQARVAELESLVRSLASGRQVGMTSPASQAE